MEKVPEKKEKEQKMFRLSDLKPTREYFTSSNFKQLISEGWEERGMLGDNLIIMKKDEKVKMLNRETGEEDETLFPKKAKQENDSDESKDQKKTSLWK